jgi:hypothetical protein
MENADGRVFIFDFILCQLIETKPKNGIIHLRIHSFSHLTTMYHQTGRKNQPWLFTVLISFYLMAAACLVSAQHGGHQESDRALDQEQVKHPSNTA